VTLIEAVSIDPVDASGRLIVSLLGSKWPSCARVSPLDTEATIILPTHLAQIVCRAHGDMQGQAITLTTGAPSVSDGNGHPEETTATHWGRCPTCNRLFLVKANTTYRRFSHRVDILLDQDTYLDEGDPDANKSGLSVVHFDSTTGLQRFPTFAFAPVTDTLPFQMTAIKAEVHMYADALVGTSSLDTYKIKREDLAIGESTWNEFKTGTGWSTPGAKGDDTDRDTTKKFASLLSLPSGVGWKTVLSGSSFTSEVEAMKEQSWSVCLYAATGTIEFAGVEAGGNKPFLRVWYE
jgi:hypothetical protein